MRNSKTETSKKATKKQVTEAEEVQAVEDYGEELERAFYNALDRLGIENTDKRKNLIDSVFIALHDTVYAIEKHSYNCQKNKLVYYDVYNMKKLVDKYCELCGRHNTIPKLDIFARMTGIKKDVLMRWHNANKGDGYIVRFGAAAQAEETELDWFPYPVPKIKKCTPSMTAEEREISSFRVDILKCIREYSQAVVINNLSDSPLGNSVIANNDTGVGLMWDARRQLTAAAIEQNKNALGAQELPKLTGF